MLQSGTHQLLEVRALLSSSQLAAPFISTCVEQSSAGTWQAYAFGRGDHECGITNKQRVHTASCVVQAHHRTPPKGNAATNDPSAGSPAETLLRLFPSSEQHGSKSSPSNSTRQTYAQSCNIHRAIPSVGATGGVYKGQGHNQHELMTQDYWEFLAQD